MADHRARNELRQLEQERDELKQTIEDDAAAYRECADARDEARAEVERLRTEIAEWQEIGPNALRVIRQQDERLERLQSELETERERGTFTPGDPDTPGWCGNCGRHRSFHRNHPGQEPGAPQWCEAPND